MPDEEKDLYQKINSGNKTYESYNIGSSITENQIQSSSKDKIFYTAPT